MQRSIAIIFGAALIAASILIANHWTINITSDSLVNAMRLNRWTGEIELCAVDPKTVKMSDSGFVGAGELECSR